MSIKRQVINGAEHITIQCDQVTLGSGNVPMKVNGIELKDYKLIPTGKRAYIYARCYATARSTYMTTQTDGATSTTLTGIVQTGSILDQTNTESGTKYNLTSPSGTVLFRLVSATNGFTLEAYESANGIDDGYASAQIEIMILDYDAGGA